MRKVSIEPGLTWTSITGKAHAQPNHILTSVILLMRGTLDSNPRLFRYSLKTEQKWWQ